jgi:galactokinase
MSAGEAGRDRVDALVAAFEQRYGRVPDGIAEAPGRVNLIGEHVDYNDGLVLPFAIDRTVLCAWARRADDATRVHSLDFDDDAAFTARERLVGLQPGSARSWRSYVRGVFHVFAGATEGSPVGLDMAIAGNVPQGAGLSSSAAVEVAVAGAIRHALDLEIDDVALARLCQRAENEYVGVQSGIMDQFASVRSREGHALLIDCRTLDHFDVPLRLGERGLAIVVADSAVARELASSAYNQRRRECEAAVALLRERLRRPGLGSLRDITATEFGGIRELFGEEGQVALRRARHVIGEIARVESGVAALAGDDFEVVGELMAASHASLREDYEVSSAELDLLVELASAQPYVLGSRMTGAGFGGCTVTLLEADAVHAFDRDVMATYRDCTGHRQAQWWCMAPSSGLRTDVR